MVYLSCEGSLRALLLVCLATPRLFGSLQDDRLQVGGQLDGYLGRRLCGGVHLGRLLHKASSATVEGSSRAHLLRLRFAVLCAEEGHLAARSGGISAAVQKEALERAFCS